MKTILILEDIVETQDWLVRIVGSLFSRAEILRADTCAAGANFVATRKIDMALIDLALPDGNGLEVLKKLVRSQPDAIAVVATAMGEDDAIVKALAAGAVGYIMKSDTENLVRLHLHQLAQGLPALSPAIARRIMTHFAAASTDRDGNAHPGSSAATAAPPNATTPDLAPNHNAATDATCAAAESPLSPREREVLSLIGKGLRIKDCADVLSLTENTIATHIKAIYRKLGINTRAEAALAATRLGLWDMSLGE